MARSLLESWLLRILLLKNPAFFSKLVPRFSLLREVFSYNMDVMDVLSFEFYVAFMYWGSLSCGQESVDCLDFAPASLFFLANTEHNI